MSHSSAPKGLLEPSLQIGDRKILRSGNNAVVIASRNLWISVPVCCWRFAYGCCSKRRCGEPAGKVGLISTTDQLFMLTGVPSVSRVITCSILLYGSYLR